MKPWTALILAGFSLGLATGAGAAPGGAFNASDPADLVSALAGAKDVTAALKTDERGVRYIAAKLGELDFEVELVGCDAAQRGCAAATYMFGVNTQTVTLDQINQWNRAALPCAAFLSAEGHPRMWYVQPLSSHATQDDIVAGQGVWTQCLSGFVPFVKDPAGFLKANP